MEPTKEILKAELEPEYALDTDILKITAARMDTLGSDLKDRFDSLTKDQEVSALIEDWAEDLAAYHLLEPKRELPYEGAPNLRCVLTRIGVDASHANRMYAFCGQENYVKVEPDYISRDFVNVADKGAQYLTYQLRYEADFYTALDDADRKADMYGIGYLEPRYCRKVSYDTIKKTEMVEQQVIDPLTGQVTTEQKPRTKTVREERVVFDGIKIDSLPVENVVVSPYFRSIEEAVENDVVFKKCPKKFRAIKAGTQGDSPLYIKSQVDKLETACRGRILDRFSKLEQERRRLDKFDITRQTDDEVVNLVEAYLWEDVDGDGKPEEIKAVFDSESGTIIRVSLSKCRIVELRPRPVDERFHGESIRRASDPILKEWESIHNGRVIKNDWSNNTFFFYQAGGRFNPQETQLKPATGYPVDNPNSVYFPQISGPGPSGYQEESLLMNYWERIIGISENMQSVGGSKDTTATENINLNQKASIRQSNQVSRVSMALEKLLSHMWDLNRECAPATKEYFVVGLGKGGRTFDKMAREDYASQVKFKLQISTIFDQQLQRDTWLMAFRMFRQDPLVMNHPAAAYELFKNTLRGMNITLDIPKPPQAEALSPSEEHELMRKGEQPEPVPGEDYDEHLRRHTSWMKTEEFDKWSPEEKQALAEHIDKTKILKQTLESANLNKSGIFEGMPGGQQPQMPGMTASKNPSQQMNNMRIGETSKSAMQNLQNGQYGGDK
jgi:hypothetical protein